jgi:acetate kinase
MDVKKILQQQALFKDITDDSLALLEKEAKVLDFEPEEEIITYGHAGRYFAIVLKGQLAVFDSEENQVAIIKEGEFLGEMSLLTGEPSIADVRSAAASRLMMIPHSVMSLVISKNPGMIKQLASTMRVRLMQREGSFEEKDALRAARGSLPGPEDLLAGPGGSEMKILVINCGSSSLKWNFYETASSERIAGGLIECIGFENARHTIKMKNKNSGKEKVIEKHLPDADHAAAIQDVLDFLTGEKGPLNSLEEIDAIGHRVVHGGEKYTSPVVIDDDVIAKVKSLFVLAPLHNPVNLVGIEAAKEILPHVPQVAVFDTAFHQTMPPHAYLYGLPYKFYKENGIRRYGFHGTSHYYVAMQAAAYLKRPLSELKIISCHLGNGASICAIDHGRSIDTSMGLTPLEGLIMGSRSGDVDAGILFYLAREYNLGVEELHGLLNKKSGLAGLSGVSNDMREISEAASEGGQQALMAIQVFCYRIKKYIGAYVAALDGLDVLIFTGGIGLGAPGVRARVCQGLDRLGIVLDVMKNHFFAKPDSTKEISDPASAVKVLVIPTDEEKMIARETMRALQQYEVAKIIEMPANRQRQVPIYVYEKHVHLSENHRDVLFGRGYTLTEVEGESVRPRGLYRERVHLIGPKGRIEDVKICAPMKPDSMVEIGRTEEFLLGIDAPIRVPGEIAGTPGVTLEGPKGKVALKQGVINAPQRILMQPEDALAFGLRDGDRVVFAVDAAHSHVFGDVLIRVRPNLTLGMHLNMDDAKAAEVEVKEGMTGRIVGIVETQAR